MLALIFPICSNQVYRSLEIAGISIARMLHVREVWFQMSYTVFMISFYSDDIRMTSTQESKSPGERLKDRKSFVFSIVLYFLDEVGNIGERSSVGFPLVLPGPIGMLAWMNWPLENISFIHTFKFLRAHRGLAS